MYVSCAKGLHVDNIFECVNIFMGYSVALGLVCLFDLNTMFVFDTLDNSGQIFAQIP